MPMRDLIVRTKLYRPRLSSDLVLRGRLLELFASSDEKPLTLVSAPAGYGKSVVVSQWIEESGQPAAWVSLDSDDGELQTFLAYVLAALETVEPGACRATAGLLAAPELPPVSTVGDHLLNDLDALQKPCVLVLDDYHRIDVSSPVHELLNRLLRHPPRRLRIVLVTRRDPPLTLARARAENRLAEVRLEGLRFTDTETAAFLATATQHTVGDVALRNLQHEVEGWAVGLRLVTLALRHAPDPDAFLCGMQGGLALTREYLLQEVLASLSAEMRRFLLRSSILDRFCADLLDALTETHEGNGETAQGARAFLRELQDSNLFTIPLDVRSDWFRYHHLFQELLANELRRVEGPEVVAELHARASTWFEAAVLIDEALQHALAAGDMQRAVRLVESHRESVVNDDRWYVLERWLGLLPESEVQTHPDLLMARGWLLLHHFRFEAVLPLADQVESLLGDDPHHDQLRGEIGLFRGYILFFMGDGAASLQHIEVALAHIPVGFFEARAQSEVIGALSKQMVGRKDEALSDLEDLLARYDSPEELRKTRLVITKVFIHYLAGDLTAAETANRHLREIAERGSYAYATAWVEYMQGLIHLQRCELEAAAEHLARSVAQRFIHFKRAAVDSTAGLMFVQRVLGRAEEAQATRERLRDYVTTVNDPLLRALVDSAEARLAVMTERPERAAAWLAAGDPAAAGAMIWWLEMPAVTRCRVQVASADSQQIAEASARLEELAAECEAHHNVTQLVGILALLAVARARQGEAATARDSLKRAVALAKPGSIVFPFVEAGASLVALLDEMSPDAETAPFVARLRAACSGLAVRSSSAAVPTPEPVKAPLKAMAATEGGALDDLTSREMDVLKLLEGRMRDREIATRMDISVHTVRHHLKQIYQKLDVHGRRQAVQYAHELGLLGDDERD